MSSPDNDLFELCKKVHEKTGWKSGSATRFEWYTDVSGHLQVNMVNGRDYMPPSEHVLPLYTSDYLLEKLPNKIKGKHSTGWLTLSPMDKETWSAGYEADHTEHIDDYKLEWSDTPLKALLKLTIALHEAGVKI